MKAKNFTKLTLCGVNLVKVSLSNVLIICHLNQAHRQYVDSDVLAVNFCASSYSPSIAIAIIRLFQVQVKLGVKLIPVLKENLGMRLLGRYGSFHKKWLEKGLSSKKIFIAIVDC